jgi:hypothetical protein
MTVRIPSPIAAASTALALCVLGASTGLAQDDYVRSVPPQPLPERPAVPEQPPAVHDPGLVSATRLEQFVLAQIEIESIQADVIAELEATTDEREARELRREGEARVRGALDRAELSSEEYRHLAALVGADPELEERAAAKREMLEPPR